MLRPSTSVWAPAVGQVPPITGFMYLGNQGAEGLKGVSLGVGEWLRLRVLDRAGGSLRRGAKRTERRQCRNSGFRLDPKP